MAGELVLFVIGAVLILAGIASGRVGAGADRPPRLGRTPRLAAGGVGVMCVVAGAIIALGPTARSGPFRVAVTDALGPDQVSEQIRVILDGRDVGVVKVDTHAPLAALSVTVANAGRHQLRLEARRQLKGQKPTAVSTTSAVVIDDKTGRLVALSDAQGHTFLVPGR